RRPGRARHRGAAADAGGRRGAAAAGAVEPGRERGEGRGAAHHGGGGGRGGVWSDTAGRCAPPPSPRGAAPAGERVALSVTDEGPGIAPEARERVLDPFYRLPPRAPPPRAAAGGGGGRGVRRRAPAAPERVVDPFYRLDAARTPGQAAPAGVGLGLTFARRVAEVHG